MRISMVSRVFSALCIICIMVQGALAVAPPDAPPIVIEPPSGDTGVIEATSAASPLEVPVLPEFPVWMAVLGAVLIAAGAGGCYLLRCPKTYVPRSKRLQK